MKNIVVSGIQPTGILTLGNYIGAIKHFVEMQDEHNMFIMVVDLHALTADIEPKELINNTRSVIAFYLAAGLDPKKISIFKQSDIAEHSQLSWVLENQTTIGELSRMTQFKDKSGKDIQDNKTVKVKTGILTYPALMAADILLYKPQFVPVGEDQKQHLELTKTIAKRFNNKFGETFVIPEYRKAKIGAKIMSLTDPNKKMSKSSKSINGFISLLDDPNLAAKKIMKAVTDSEGKVYLSDQKPGIKNLLTIYSALKDKTLEEAESKFKSYNYGEFKIEVSNVIKEFLIDIQKKYNKYLTIVDNVLKNGAIEAKKIAKKTLEEVYQKIGLK